MSPLKDMLENKSRNGKKVLSIFLTAGYPDPAATLPLLEAIVAGGADLIELGVPFSD
ncbi:MAG: tryptophan synthase subunit alpha, partial [Calditrichaeota bacterium]|nr:tryptophan synthase subunit alpha [Calditrichota bacterium]